MGCGCNINNIPTFASTNALNGLYNVNNALGNNLNNNNLNNNINNLNNNLNNLNNILNSPVPVCKNRRTFSSARIPTIPRRRRYPPRSINSARIPTGRADDSRSGRVMNPMIKRNQALANALTVVNRGCGRRANSSIVF
jgi:hypothetical protein